jgi:hypothetical protein
MSKLTSWLVKLERDYRSINLFQTKYKEQIMTKNTNIEERKATMNTTLYSVRLNFITPLLGTQPQKDIALEHTANRYTENGGVLPDDELGTFDEELQKGTTGFHKIDGKPILYDYQIKGFLKEAGLTFNGLHGVKALRSKIDKYVFVTPRQIFIHMPEGSVIDYLERPLRADTPKGQRVGIARSEMIPEGSWVEFGLKVYDGPIDEEMLRDLFSYAQDKGFLQWRNGGYGRATFTLKSGNSVVMSTR